MSQQSYGPNVHNILRMQAAGGAVDLATHIGVKAGGHAFGWPSPPHGIWNSTSVDGNESAIAGEAEFVEKVSAYRPAQRSMLTVTRLALQLDGIKNSDRLTPAGRKEEALKLCATGATAATLARQFEKVESEKAKFDASVKTLLIPPPIVVGDADGALVDQEARAFIRQTGPDALATLLQEALASDAHDRVLLAMKRSPVPLKMDETQVRLFDDAWRASVLRRNPDQARAVFEHEKAIDWAHSVVKQSAGMVQGLLDQHVGGDGASRYDIWNAVSAIPGGTKLFGFDGPEALGYELKKAMAAA